MWIVLVDRSFAGITIKVLYPDSVAKTVDLIGIRYSAFAAVGIGIEFIHFRTFLILILIGIDKQEIALLRSDP